MAEIQKTGSKEDASEGGFFQGNKRIPTVSFMGYLASAAFVDFAFWWLPVAGDVFIAYCRGMYWLNGYRTVRMGAATWIDVFVEGMPGLQEFPGCVVFVGWTYAINRSTTKKPSEEEKQDRPKFSLSEKIAAAGYAYINMQTRTGAGSRGRNIEKTQGGEETEGRGVGGNIGISVASYGLQKKVEGAKEREGTGTGEPIAQNKSVQYQTDRSVDGVRKPVQQPPKDTGYRPTQPVFRQQSEPLAERPERDTGQRKAA